MGGHIRCSSSLGRGSKFWFNVSLCLYSSDTMAFLDREDDKEQPCKPSGTFTQP